MTKMLSAMPAHEDAIMEPVDKDAVSSTKRPCNDQLDDASCKRLCHTVEADTIIPASEACTESAADRVSENRPTSDQADKNNLSVAADQSESARAQTVKAEPSIHGNGDITSAHNDVEVSSLSSSGQQAAVPPPSNDTADAVVKTEPVLVTKAEEKIAGVEPYSTAAEGTKIDAKPERDLELVDVKADEDPQLGAPEDDIGPVVGLRIEVKWELTDDTTGGPVPTWFTGTLSRDLASRDQEDRALWQLDYEPLGEFEACTRTVAFTRTGEMWDTEDKEYLEWRREGEELDHTENMVVSMEDILREQAEIDSEEGTSVHDASLAAFQSLPFERQAALAVQFRTFADSLKMGLGELIREKGADGVVTKADVEAILERMRGGRRS